MYTQIYNDKINLKNRRVSVLLSIIKLPATTGCGLAIGPQAALCLENSGNHSLIAFLKASLGWYMFGDKVFGTSSPDKPSSVSVSNLISADTVSSKMSPRFYKKIKFSFFFTYSDLNLVFHLHYILTIEPECELQ